MKEQLAAENILRLDFLYRSIDGPAYNQSCFGLIKTYDRPYSKHAIGPLKLHRSVVLNGRFFRTWIAT